MKTWKVQPSNTKCVMTTFTLDPKESGGKVKPQLSFCGQPLGYEETPTFLDLKLDCQLTFAAHIAALKEKMGKRRACLSAIAGRSYGSHRSTLRIAYQNYVRSLFDYGAAVYFTHAAPAVRERLEVELAEVRAPDHRLHKAHGQGDAHSGGRPPSADSPRQGAHSRRVRPYPPSASGRPRSHPPGARPNTETPLPGSRGVATRGNGSRRGRLATARARG